MSEANYKVLMTLMSMDIGGAETHVLELCKALKRRGADVYVASNGGSYEAELVEFGIKHFKAPLHNKRITSIYKSYKILEKIIEENGIRLVHAHARIPAFICNILRRKLNFRFVTTVHWDFTLSFPWNILSQWGDRSLAVSEDLKQYLIKSYKVPERDILVTINGIDTEKFSPAAPPESVIEELGLAPGKTRIIHVSRMDRKANRTSYKIMEAVSTLRSEFPGLELIVVGGGDDEENVFSEAQRRNAEAKEEYILAVGKRVDVVSFLRLGKIFVGISRAALEAMSVGLPVILAGDPGYIGAFEEKTLQKCVDTNFTCRLCGEPTVNAIAAELRGLLRKSGQELESMGEYCRNMVCHLYSVDRMCQDAISLYESVRYSDRPMDALISGYYGFNNNGDDIVLKSVIDGLKEDIPNADIAVLSMRPRETKAIYGVKAINRYHFPQILSMMKKTKLLITGGGGLIQDITSTKSLIYYLWLIGTASRFGARNMLYANGIGPVKKPRNIANVRKSLNRVELITLRDEQSLETLARFGVSKPEMHVTADAAFSLKHVDMREAEDYLKSLGLSKKYFGVAVRSWKFNKPGFEEELARFADYIQEEYGFAALFIPMRPVEDSDISKRIIGLMKTPGLFFGEKYTTNQVIGAVGMAELMVGMRLHTLIYAAKSGTPVIGLVYDKKVEVMMDALDQKFYRPVEDFKWEELKGYADDILADKEAISGNIMAAGLKAREKSEENIRLCLDLLKRPLF
ncbi:MAG: polysaccharide pyruvyl transferase CsaB [Clostridiales bacterium]|jgi:polysaccharide pyruvyl transferase CsaB|nr:polysaccharide pyruvyl transferase CsaB [Clostridiales bacterium]